MVDPHRPNESAPSPREPGIARDAGGNLSPWVTFAVALFASIAIHVPAIQGVAKLGEWSHALDLFARTEPPPPIEIEIEETPAVEPPVEEPEVEPPRAREEAPVAPVEEEPAPPPPEPPRPTEMVEERVVPIPPRPRITAPLAVRQRSRDPSVAPDDPQYIADENNRVEEETVARVTNDQLDSPETQTARADETSAPDDGNAEAEEVADLRDREGANDRAPTPREAVMPRPERASTEPLPNVEAAGEADQRPLERRAGTEAREATPPTAPTEIRDSDGSLAVAIREAITEGPSREATEAAEAGLEGRDRRGEDRRSRRGQRRGMGMQGPDLRVSWREFEETIPEQELEEERERWLEERRSRIRGSNREREWRQFRSAIENYVPNVRPGNQTALNAAASPFANYLSDVHRRIHREFAHGFIPGLPAGGDSPFSDMTLYTKLEIILNQDGTVHRVGVVQPSGLLPFDLGAFRSVMRGQPYPEPPSSILSGDGRVYFHWGFYRNQRQCGTFNAEPYILPHPPGVPRPGRGPFVDEPSRGGVIPADATPDWGIDRAPHDGPGGPTPEEPSEEQNRAPPIAPPPRPPSLAPLDDATLG